MSKDDFSNAGPRRTTPKAFVTQEVKAKILAKYQNKCAMCSSDGAAVPLDIAFLLSRSNGGEAVEENLIALCANCHAAFDSAPREVEFTSFLAELLRKNQNFESVRLGAC